MRRATVLVNVTASILLLSCGSERADSPSVAVQGPVASTVHRTSATLGGPALQRVDNGTRSAALPPPPQAIPFDGPETHIDALMPDVQMVPDPSRGAALVDALANLDPERAALGIQGLTPADLDSLCEYPLLSMSGSDGNGPWEISIETEPFVWLTAPQRYLVSLPAACADDLLALGGPSGAGACSEEDEAAFFPTGSSCRTCLEVDGDFDRCVQETECPVEATRHALASPAGSFANEMYSVLVADSLSCAPDLDIPVLLLVPDLDEDDPLPGVYEHGRIEQICTELWSGQSLAMYCSPTISPIANVLLDVLPARISEVVQDGSPPHRRRIVAPASIAVPDGRRYDLAIGYEIPLAVLSAPMSLGGWGFPPTEVRPDGSDPAVVDDTYARDWLAGLALKTTTTIDGIPVWGFNRNRCSDWSEPEPDGSRTCRTVDSWDLSGVWSDDGMISWFDYDAGTSYAFPFTTLVSTGLVDPDVPGGLALHVMPSETLARIEGDSCGWTRSFVPDRMRLYDDNPPGGVDPYSAFDGETWRFGRDDLDIRLGLATNQYRGFCPE